MDELTLLLIGEAAVATLALVAGWVHRRRRIASWDPSRHTIEGDDAEQARRDRVEFASRRRRVRPRERRGYASAYPRVTPATRPAPPMEREPRSVPLDRELRFVLPTRREP